MLEKTNRNPKSSPHIYSVYPVISNNVPHSEQSDQCCVHVYMFILGNAHQHLKHKVSDGIKCIHYYSLLGNDLNCIMG